MRSWLVLLAGLLVWAVHFFALYAIGEFGGDHGAARIAVGLSTALCLAITAVLLAKVLRAPHSAGFERWRASVATGGLCLAAIAIAWQSLPALFPS